MTKTATAVLLYALAGALEAGGVATIGADLYGRRKRAKTYTKRGQVIDVTGVSARARGGRARVTVDGPEPDLQERVAAHEQRMDAEHERVTDMQTAIREAIDDATAGAKAALDRRVREREQEIIGLVGALESLLPAWAGFLLLFAGVLVGTAANILSAVK